MVELRSHRVLLDSSKQKHDEDPTDPTFRADYETKRSRYDQIVSRLQPVIFKSAQTLEQASRMQALHVYRHALSSEDPSLRKSKSPDCISTRMNSLEQHIIDGRTTLAAQSDSLRQERQLVTNALSKLNETIITIQDKVDHDLASSKAHSKQLEDRIVTLQTEVDQLTAKGNLLADEIKSQFSKSHDRGTDQEDRVTRQLDEFNKSYRAELNHFKTLNVTALEDLSTRVSDQERNFERVLKRIDAIETHATDHSRRAASTGNDATLPHAAHDCEQRRNQDPHARQMVRHSQPGQQALAPASALRETSAVALSSPLEMQHSEDGSQGHSSSISALRPNATPIALAQGDGTYTCSTGQNTPNMISPPKGGSSKPLTTQDQSVDTTIAHAPRHGEPLEVPHSYDQVTTHGSVFKYLVEKAPHSTRFRHVIFGILDAEGSLKVLDGDLQTLGNHVHGLEHQIMQLSKFVGWSPGFNRLPPPSNGPQPPPPSLHQPPKRKRSLVTQA